MDRCTKCILPENYPRLDLDSDGVCKFCRITLHAPSKSDFDKVKMLVNTYKQNKRGKYDCLVPLSGGKDSSYVLYLCKKKFGLNPLAMNYNNGWQADEAVKNVENLTKRLGVDLVKVAHPWDLMSKLYAKAFTESGECCSPCVLGISSFMYKIAREHSINLIVWGRSARTEGALPPEVQYFDPRYFRALARDVLSPSQIKDFLYPTEWDYTKMLFKDKIRILSFPYYLEWDENAIAETLKRELGWITPSHTAMRFDCKISPIVHEYLIKKKLGFTFQEHKYSLMIRDDQLTREQALENLSDDEGKIGEERFPWFLKKLGLDESALDAYLSHSPVDIPSYLNILRRTKPIIKLFSRMGVLPEDTLLKIV